jgi:hypothetical protein
MRGTRVYPFLTFEGVHAAWANGQVDGHEEMEEKRLGSLCLPAPPVAHGSFHSTLILAYSELVRFARMLDVFFPSGRFAESNPGQIRHKSPAFKALARGI